VFVSDGDIVLSEMREAAPAPLLGDRLLGFAEFGEQVHEDVGDRDVAGDGEPDAPGIRIRKAQLASRCTTTGTTTVRSETSVICSVVPAGPGPS
jgi:hypothetical protein